MNINNLELLITNFLLSIGILGYILSCILIIFESIIPVLPLSVFVTLLFYKFGPILGFILSYVSTIVGCILAYSLFSVKFSDKFKKYIKKKNNEQLTKIVNRVEKIKFENLCLIIALPFTPSFLINVGAGLSGIKLKKYFFALIIGKIFIIFFWGFIGTSLISSIKDPINLVYIISLLILCFIISRLISKKEGIK